MVPYSRYLAGGSYFRRVALMSRGGSLKSIAQNILLYYQVGHRKVQVLWASMPFANCHAKHGTVAIWCFVIVVLQSQTLVTKARVCMVLQRLGFGVLKACLSSNKKVQCWRVKLILHDYDGAATSNQMISLCFWSQNILLYYQVGHRKIQVLWASMPFTNCHAKHGTVAIWCFVIVVLQSQTLVTKARVCMVLQRLGFGVLKACLSSNKKVQRWWVNSPRDTLHSSTYTTWAVPVTWVNCNCAHLPFHSTLQVQQMKPHCETRMRIWSPFAFLQPTTMATLHTSPCRWPHLPSPFPPFLLT